MSTPAPVHVVPQPYTSDGAINIGRILTGPDGQPTQIGAILARIVTSGSRDEHAIFTRFHEQREQIIQQFRAAGFNFDQDMQYRFFSALSGHLAERGQNGYTRWTTLEPLDAAQQALGRTFTAQNIRPDTTVTVQPSQAAQNPSAFSGIPIAQGMNVSGVNPAAPSYPPMNPQSVNPPPGTTAPRRVPGTDVVNPPNDALPQQPQDPAHVLQMLQQDQANPAIVQKPPQLPSPDPTQVITTTRPPVLAQQHQARRSPGLAITTSVPPAPMSAIPPAQAQSVTSPPPAQSTPAQPPVAQHPPAQAQPAAPPPAPAQQQQTPQAQFATNIQAATDPVRRHLGVNQADLTRNARLMTRVAGDGQSPSSSPLHAGHMYRSAQAPTATALLRALEASGAGSLTAQQLGDLNASISARQITAQQATALRMAAQRAGITSGNMDETQQIAQVQQYLNRHVIGRMQQSGQQTVEGYFTSVRPQAAPRPATPAAVAQAPAPAPG